MTVEVTSVVNAHREAHTLTATIRSALRSMQYASKSGIVCKLLIVLDRADTQTKEIATRLVGEAGSVTEVDFGDLALSRNHAVSICDTEYITFLDGDDLWCETWVVDCVLLAMTRTDPCVFHPEYNIYFGDDSPHVLRHVDMEDPIYEKAAMPRLNYWTALSFGPTQIYRDFPYRELMLNNGFGYEDWSWNKEIIDAGVKHGVVPATAHFIRRSSDSLLMTTRGSRSIPRVLDIYAQYPVGRNTVERHELEDTYESLAPLVDINSQSRGAIDGIKDGVLRGWIDAPPESGPLTLMVDGVAMKHVVAKGHRHDVQRAHGIEGARGFGISLGSLPKTKVSEVRLLHKASGFDFDDFSFKYCALVKEFREKLSGIFLPEFYRHRYRLAELSNEEAFQFYINYGIYADHDPNPWFDSSWYKKNYAHKLSNIEVPILSYLNFEKDQAVRASAFFDTLWYKQANRDLPEDYGLLWHYVNFGHAEGRMPSERLLPELVNSEVQELIAFEPRIADAKRGLRNVIQYPHLSRSTYVPSLLKQRYGNSIEAIICVPYISRGGADLISTFAYRAYCQALGKEKVLFLVTDKPAIDVPGWLSRDGNVVCLDNEASFKSRDDKVHAVHAIIGTLCPRIVLNCNSHVLWDVYAKYGRQLSTATSLQAYLFCFDYCSAGDRAGYIRDYLPEVIDNLDVVFCDNRKVIDEIGVIYGFSPRNADKFKVLYSPLPPKLKIGHALKSDSAGTDSSSRKILWIGRMARQKRPDLLLKIADALPQFEFDIYGPTTNLDSSKRIGLSYDPNINYKGVYDDVSQIDFSQYALFLNTSEWEGLPTMLIQAMATGIPIVTSLVGGIDELVNEDTGWTVDDVDDVDEYVSQIKRLVVRDDIRDVKACAGVELVKKRHQWWHYFSRLEHAGAFDRSLNAIDDGASESPIKHVCEDKISVISDYRLAG